MQAEMESLRSLNIRMQRQHMEAQDCAIINYFCRDLEGRLKIQLHIRIYIYRHCTCMFRFIKYMAKLYYIHVIANHVSVLYLFDCATAYVLRV